MMMSKTLKEYLDEYGPGGVKLTCWDADSLWFSPYFMTVSGIVNGLDQAGKRDHYFVLDGECWQIWTEPKKKKTVTLYQWLIREVSLSGSWALTTHTDANFSSCGKRLDDTALTIEVDE